MNNNFDVAVVDETVYLYIAADLNGPVTVKLTNWKEGATAGADVIDSEWTENATAEAVSAEDIAKMPDAKAKILWKVGLAAPDSAPSHPMPRGKRQIAADVYEGSNTDPANPGSKKKITVLRELRVPGFVVTDKVRIRRIMIHEFGVRKADGTEDINEDAVYSYFNDNTTMQQRILLSQYDTIPFAGNRLVLMFTLQKDRDLRMHMEDSFCLSFKSNATLMVFHVRKPGDDITLVSATDYIFIGMQNQSTRDLLVKKSKNGDPNTWLSRDNITPPVFRVGSVCFTDTFVWHQLHDAKGAPAMKGNFIHGTCATHGCWSLYKNWNLHRSIKDKIDVILLHNYRSWLSDKKAKDKLIPYGYDVPDDYIESETLPDGTFRKKSFCSSLSKMYAIERNWAYVWFTRDIVGIRYFSESHNQSRSFQQRYLSNIPFEKTVLTAQAVVREVVQPDGSVKDELVTKEVSVRDDFINLNGDPRPTGGTPAADPPKYFSHHLKDRLKKDWRFKISDDLFIENELGFKAADGFAPPNATAPLSKTWGDCFFFRADDLDISTIKGPYTVTPQEKP